MRAAPAERRRQPCAQLLARGRRAASRLPELDRRSRRSDYRRYAAWRRAPRADSTVSTAPCARPGRRGPRRPPAAARSRRPSLARADRPLETTAPSIGREGCSTRSRRLCGDHEIAPGPDQRSAVAVLWPLRRDGRAARRPRSRRACSTRSQPREPRPLRERAGRAAATRPRRRRLARKRARWRSRLDAARPRGGDRAGAALGRGLLGVLSRRSGELRRVLERALRLLAARDPPHLAAGAREPRGRVRGRGTPRRVRRRGQEPVRRPRLSAALAEELDGVRRAVADLVGAVARPAAARACCRAAPTRVDLAASSPCASALTELDRLADAGVRGRAATGPSTRSARRARADRGVALDCCPTGCPVWPRPARCPTSWRGRFAALPLTPVAARGGDRRRDARRDLAPRARPRPLRRPGARAPGASAWSALHEQWLESERRVRARAEPRALPRQGGARLGPVGAAHQGAEDAFKRRYNRGRRELEHEFGKTMRYKSIRDSRWPGRPAR